MLLNELFARKEYSAADIEAYGGYTSNFNIYDGCDWCEIDIYVSRLRKTFDSIMTVIQITHVQDNIISKVLNIQ